MDPLAHCPRCGLERLPGMGFCGRCGYSFAVDHATGWAPQPSVPPPLRVSPRKRTLRTALLVVGVITAFVVGISGAAVWTGSQGNGTAVGPSATLQATSRPVASPSATAPRMTSSAAAARSATAAPTPTQRSTPAPASNPTPEPTASPERTAPPTVYAKLTARAWAKIVKAPDDYLGNGYQIWGCVTQFDAATGPDSFRAQASYQKQAYWYSDGDNAYFTGAVEDLADIVADDVVLMNVISGGSYSYDTQTGGNTTVPSFVVTKISRKGSCA
jgi:hypothetical protein